MPRSSHDHSTAQSTTAPSAEIVNARLRRALTKIAAHDLNGCEHEKLAQCVPTLREMAENALKFDGSGYGQDDNLADGYAVVVKHRCGEWVLRSWSEDHCPRCVRESEKRTREHLQAALDTIRELRRRLGLVQLDTTVSEQVSEWLNSYPWPTNR